MLVLSKTAGQVILYAKGHYQVTDSLRDLRTIIARGAAVPAEAVSDADIIRAVCEATYPFIDGEHRFTGFFTDLCKREFPLRFPDLIAELLSVLRGVQVKDAQGNVILSLGEPDPKILPRTKAAPH